jgi:hypothetical protein
MGIALCLVQLQVSMATGHSCTEPKPHYKNSDLPFNNHIKELKIWCNKVQPVIIDWASTLDDLFAMGAHPNFKSIVKHHWDEHFPSMEITNAVYSVVSNDLSRTIAVC